ncbi:putative alkyl/aryl-sulfatase YjcS [compost metagenome]
MIDSIPNVGTPFRTLRDTVRWAQTLERMAALQPRTVVREFGPTLQGTAECERVLGQTAGALRWLRAEVVRLMNAGCNERQMLAALKPPAELFEQPWMRPTYGDPSYIARDIYRSENGWWDRNATTLHPAAPQDAAAEIASAVADHGALIRHAQALAERGETQLALHVIDVLALAPGDAPALAEARRLKAGWLRQRAGQVRSYVSRSLYGAAADMLEHGADDTFGIH